MLRTANKLDKSNKIIRESTVIGKMLTQSKEKLGKEFDHNKVRDAIVAQKSMFKEGKQMHDLISNDAFFLKSLKGEEALGLQKSSTII